MGEPPLVYQGKSHLEMDDLGLPPILGTAMKPPGFPALAVNRPHGSTPKGQTRASAESVGIVTPWRIHLFEDIFDTTQWSSSYMKILTGNHKDVPMKYGAPVDFPLDQSIEPLDVNCSDVSGPEGPIYASECTENRITNNQRNIKKHILS